MSLDQTVLHQRLAAFLAKTGIDAEATVDGAAACEADPALARSLDALATEAAVRAAQTFTTPELVDVPVELLQHRDPGFTAALPALIARGLATDANRHPNDDRPAGPVGTCRITATGRFVSYHLVSTPPRAAAREPGPSARRR